MANLAEARPKVCTERCPTDDCLLFDVTPDMQPGKRWARLFWTVSPTKWQSEEFRNYSLETLALFWAMPALVTLNGKVTHSEWSCSSLIHKRRVVFSNIWRRAVQQIWFCFVKHDSSCLCGSRWSASASQTVRWSPLSPDSYSVHDGLSHLHGM